MFHKAAAAALIIIFCSFMSDSQSHDHIGILTVENSATRVDICSDRGRVKLCKFSENSAINLIQNTIDTCIVKFCTLSIYLGCVVFTQIVCNIAHIV